MKVRFFLKCRFEGNNYIENPRKEKDSKIILSKENSDIENKHYNRRQKHTH